MTGLVLSLFWANLKLRVIIEFVLYKKKHVESYSNPTNSKHIKEMFKTQLVERLSKRQVYRKQQHQSSNITSTNEEVAYKRHVLQSQK